MRKNARTLLGAVMLASLAVGQNATAPVATSARGLNPLGLQLPIQANVAALGKGWPVSTSLTGSADF
jgi:hypothetical protein